MSSERHVGAPPDAPKETDEAPDFSDPKEIERLRQLYEVEKQRRKEKEEKEAVVRELDRLENEFKQDAAMESDIRGITEGILKEEHFPFPFPLKKHDT